MIDEIALTITTEDQKHFHIEIEQDYIDDNHVQTNQRDYYKVLKEDTFPIQITPWPDSTDIQELIRLAVKIYQKNKKES